ncbi:MAG TPA: Wzz/FepE/Etk N-terminal domain-containing protein [Vicinamibacterales bacterium]|nr:Wzz/FepE/Etk N-terminal domain-containing protein [Vicinamibacterales bacterium]
MNSHLESDRELRLPTVRDLVSPLFRYWRPGLLVALLVSLGVTAVVLLMPRQYEAEMKFLVKRERADPIVSADPNAVTQASASVSEDELNSEVELLKSRDLLEDVAASSGLLSRGTSLNRPGLSRPSQQQATLARVVHQLEGDLKIAPIKKTTFIRVTYRSADPDLAAQVLNDLARLYLEKHRTLHRATGAYAFFTTQTDRFRSELAAAEARLNEYGRQEAIVSADTEQQNMLQKVADFESELQQARAKITESTKSIGDIEAQIAATPIRQTTQIRTSQNAELTRGLKAGLLDLEMKRSEMERKFTPTYPPVLELEQQLTQARAALKASEETPLTEQTTDQNPTYQWLHGELARVRTERAAAIARAAALDQSVKMFQEKARQLAQKGAAQQDLRRSVKTAEESYLLYQRKQEEARISDALDGTRIANIALAEAPAVPAFPANTGRRWLLLFGAVIGLALGTSTTYLLAYTSPHFHSPQDVEDTLGLPVLASIASRR